MRTDISGLRFNRFLVLSFSHESKGHASWNCLCDCGEKRTVAYSGLTSGHSKSCGCIYHHGGEGTRIYRIQKHMIDRCENKRSISYKHYGARGIRVCDEWRKSFVAFRTWALSHGYTDSLTIDRIDNDGDYEPSNCQWLTNAENVSKARRQRKKIVA